MPRYAYCLFDLDGTLTDPGKELPVRSPMRCPFSASKSKTAPRLYPLSDRLWWRSFSTFYGFSPEQARQAVGRYREYFSRQGIFENDLYPGIKELLENLKRHG